MAGAPAGAYRGRFGGGVKGNRRPGGRAGYPGSGPVIEAG